MLTGAVYELDSSAVHLEFNLEYAQTISRCMNWLDLAVTE
jgi:hypothetical protein